MRHSRLFLVISTTIALSGVLYLAAPRRLALADQAKPDYAAAKKHYAEAEKAAQEKDWARAAKEYGVAYEITRDPVLFFKLGNAYQLSGDCTRAVEYFERYMAEAKPSEEYRADTQTRITSCNTSLASGTTEKPKPDETGTETEDTVTTPLPPATTTTPGLEEAAEDTSDTSDVSAGTDSERVGQPTFLDDEPTWQETAAWTSVGVSFALLSVSAILGLSADSREEDIDNLFRYRDSDGNPAEYSETVQKRYKSLIEEGEDLNTMSVVVLGLAGATTVSAIVFFVLDSSASNESEGLSSIAPTVSDDSVGVSAGWKF